MSSPPPIPGPSGVNPLKRASISSTASGSSSKRPRMHPLRQTSFPTGGGGGSSGGDQASDAGSVTGSMAGSLGGVSAATGEGVFGKKRGRKKKKVDGEDAASTRGGDALDGRSTRVGSADPDVGGAGGGEEADEDEDLEEENELFGGDEGPTDMEAEKKDMAILIDAFNPDQANRYALFKRTKLKKETLRRIVNHALSQSVPASVVTTINGFTKVFAGEIIEKARTVQQEWAEAFDLAAYAAWQREQAEAKERKARAASSAAEGKTETSEEAAPSPSTGAPPPSAGAGASGVGVNLPPGFSPAPDSATHRSPYAMTPTNENKPSGNEPEPTFKPPPNPHRGQLLPDHLREALRRYKRDCEGGGVGMSGLSLQTLGVRGAFTWGVGTGGRRLFR
ncbi:hypothetical protein VTN31DRAFT_4939 [Thermomyces dupontii]|uniref:uncharacterized protein n=1 Tax=Talaromyces thermophilus TaxID=28565 RepID=UPI003742A0B8